jgi:uncharacterized membrane protein YcaP (DUF421 family)
MPGWISILIRAVSMLLLAFIIVRITGKRNITRMAPFFLFSYLIQAIILALISVNVIKNMVYGLVALIAWFSITILIEFLALKSKWIHDFVNGRETILIKHGKVMEENLLQTRLSAEELLRELRHKNAFNLSDVEFAVLETTGDISVFMKSDKKPVTAHDLGVKVAPQTEPQTIILDGNILNESLASLGFNLQWLMNQLSNLGITKDNVFIAQVNSTGELYVDMFDDALNAPKPTVREMLYAALEKSEADLQKFSLETKNKAAKLMYEVNSRKLKELREKLEPFLLR